MTTVSCDNNWMLLVDYMKLRIRFNSNGKPLSFSNHLINCLNMIFTNYILVSLSTFIINANLTIIKFLAPLLHIVNHEVLIIYSAHSAINFCSLFPSPWRKQMIPLNSDLTGESIMEAIFKGQHPALTYVLKLLVPEVMVKELRSHSVCISASYHLADRLAARSEVEIKIALIYFHGRPFERSIILLKIVLNKIFFCQ